MWDIGFMTHNSGICSKCKITIPGNYKIEVSLILDKASASVLAFLVLREAKWPLWWAQCNVRELIFGISAGRCIPPVDLPVDVNGNFRFLLLELILADEVTDLPPSTSI